MESIEKLKKLFITFFKNEDVKIIIFGSRARGDFSKSSDIDIGIIGENINRKKLVLIREYVEEMNIPHKVDIVDFSTVSNKFRKIALNEAIYWKG